MIPVKRPFPLPACPDFSVPFSLLPTILEPFLASLIPLAIPTPEFFLEHTSEWPYRTSPTFASARRCHHDPQNDLDIVRGDLIIYSPSIQVCHSFIVSGNLRRRTIEHSVKVVLWCNGLHQVRYQSSPKNQSSSMWSC